MGPHGGGVHFSERVMEILEQLGHQFLVTLGFTLMGLVAFALAFFMIVKVTPFSLRKEIEEDHNVAFAIVIAAVILGIAHIVAATVHG
jgi:putative membrane protein